MTFSPDGTTLATATSSYLHLWDVESGKPVGVPAPHSNGITCVEFSPDGATIATACTDGAAYIWDARTGLRLGEPCRIGAGVYALAFSPDGRSLATGGDNNAATIWDFARSRRPANSIQAEGDVYSMAFCSDASALAVVAVDRVRGTWNLGSAREIAEPSPFGLRQGEVRVYLGESSPAMAVEHLWNTATARAVRPPQGLGVVENPVVYSRDGAKLAVVSNSSSVQVWDVASGTQLGEPYEHGSEVTAVRFSLDGTKLATAFRVGQVTIWDLASHRSLDTPISYGASVTRLAFSPDGEIIVLAYSDGIVRVYDANTGRPRSSPYYYGEGVNALAFSPDGSKFATAGGSGSVQLWSVATGTPLGESLRALSSAHDVAFSPDGQSIAAASIDRTVRLWDIATGNPLGEPLVHADEVYEVAFSPDGAMLATHTADSLQLWNIATGRLLGAHWDSVESAEFSPDWSQLATTSEDPIVQIWKLPRRIEEPAPQVSLWVETATGLELSKVTGATRALSVAQLAEKRHRLDEMGGAPRAYLDLIEAGVVAVEEESLDRAAELLQSGHAHAALWHIDRWITILQDESRGEQLPEAHWVRARCLVELAREEEAVAALQAGWKATKQHQAIVRFDTERFNFMRDLWLALAASGQHSLAQDCLGLLVEQVDILAARNDALPEIYARGCAHAVLAGALNASPHGAERAAQYRKSAVELLLRVLDRDWMYMEVLHTDANLDPLRDDPEFKSLVERLAKWQSLPRQADEFCDAGEFSKAVPLYREMCDRRPSFAWMHRHLAIACLATGDEVAYRAACGGLLRQFKDDGSIYSAEQLLHATVAVPGAVDDYSVVLKVAQSFVPSREADEWSFVRALAAARFRAGDDSEALKMFQSSSERTLWDYFFIAMIHERLRQHDQAVAALAEGIKAKEAARKLNPWYINVEESTLRIEAESLILGVR